jgi:hypothetical protein
MRQPVVAAVLIGAAALQCAAMVFHPTSHGSSATERVASIAAQAALSAHVHGLLILLMLAVWMALAHYASERGAAWARCAGRLYALGVAAMVGAALVSGFVAGHFAVRALRAGAAVVDMAPVVLLFATSLNQVLAGFGTVLLSCSIVVWSMDLWRVNVPLARLAAVYGVLAGLACCIAYLGGLRLDVAGMSAVVLAHALWYALLGAVLLRSKVSD